MPFKNTINLLRSERLLNKEAKEKQEVSEAWKCICMLSDNAKDLKMIDHLQKRNCQLCGAFIVGNEEEEQNAGFGSQSKRDRYDSSAKKRKSH